MQGLLPFRSPDSRQGGVIPGALRAHHGDLLLAGELAGLGEVLFGMGLGAGAEQGLEVLLGQVQMAGRGFHNEFFRHSTILLKTFLRKSRFPVPIVRHSPGFCKGADAISRYFFSL